MVFESIVTEVLNKILGQYVHNFDRNKLTLGLWGGDVVLHDLYLKATALDKLNLPIRCTYGYLGELTLKIPWNDIYYSPCLVVIDRLYLLAVPNQHTRYDRGLEAKIAWEAKQTELNRIEEAKKRELEKGNLTTRAPSTLWLKKRSEERKFKKTAKLELSNSLGESPMSETFTEKIIANIIKNIQVTIKNIHIRYEDRLSNPGNPFAVGITLSSIEMKTSQVWHGSQKVKSPHIVYKVVSMDFLSVYWNSREKLFSLLYLKDNVKLRNAMQTGIVSDTNEVHCNRYILGPIKAKANLRINTKPEDDEFNFSLSKFLLKLELEKLHARLIKMQFHDVTCFLHCIDVMSRASHYRKYRPFVSSYKGHSKQWWDFAYTCVVEEVIRKRKREWDWNHMLKYRQMTRDYAQVYKEKLLATKPSAEVLEKCEYLEDQLDVLVIIVARQIAESQLTREQLLVAKGIKKDESEGWLARWFGTKQKSEPTSLREKFNAAMTREEKEKMFRAIGYTQGEVPIYPDTFIELDFKAAIHGITIEFVDEAVLYPKVMTIFLQNVVAAFQTRPTVNGLKSTLLMYQLTVNGIGKNNKPCKLVTSDYDAPISKPLLQIIFETNPPDKKVDQRLVINAKPLTVIYDANTLSSLLDIFRTETQIPSMITVAAQEKLDELKQISLLGLHHMLETRNSLEVRADIEAPKIFIPYLGSYLLGNPVIVISLGKISVTTEPRKPFLAKGLAGEDKADIIMKSSYDNFSLNLTNLQVIYAMKGENWTNPNRDMYFLKPTTVLIQLGKCIIPNAPLIPKLKMVGKLPKLEVLLSEKRFEDCVALLRSLPMPYQGQTIRHIYDVDPAGLNPSFPVARGPFPTQAPSKAEQITPDLPQFFKNQFNFHLEEPIVMELRFLEPAMLRGAGRTPATAAFFDLFELCIVVYANIHREEAEELLVFRLENLVMTYSKYSFNSTLSLELGSVLLEHRFNGDRIKLISTPSLQPTLNTKYLVKLTYTNVDRNSPEFESKYDYQNSIIHIDFTKLDLSADCIALQSLVEWYEGLQATLIPQQKKFSDGSVRKMLREGESGVIFGASIFQGDPIKMKVNQVKETVFYQTDYGTLHVTAELGEVALTLSTNGEKLANFCIAGGRAITQIKNNTVFLSAYLSGIHVKSCIPGYFYHNILTTKDEREVLVLEIVSLPNASHETGAADLSVKLSTSRLQFAYISEFFVDIFDFWIKMSGAHGVLIDVSQAAAEVARQNVKNVYENASRIKLHIDLEAPLMIVPIKERTNEAFFLNMGHLTTVNRFMNIKVPNAQETALLDRMNVTLSNLKFSRVLFGKSAEDILEKHPIIEPISVKFTIQRNLSVGWFHDLPDFEVAGKLHPIKIFLTHVDYYLILKTLKELSSTSEESSTRSRRHAEPAPWINARPGTRITSFTKLSLTGIQRRTTFLGDERNARSTLKFAFTLERVVLELFSTNASNEMKNEGLSRASLELISVKGALMSDDSLHFFISLMDCVVDDTRPSRIAKVNRYMEHKRGTSPGGDILTNVLEMSYQRNIETSFVDVRISSFILLLNIDHLEELYHFFFYVVEEENKKSFIYMAVEEHKMFSFIEDFGGIELEKSSMTFKFKCDHPDIVLVENLDDPKVNAIVVDFEMMFTLRTGYDNMLLHGSITDLQIFSCLYDSQRKKQTKSPILNPVTLFVTGCEDTNSLKFELDTTRIQIILKPGVIGLLRKITSAVWSRDGTAKTHSEEPVDRSTMWDVEEFSNSEFTFLHPERLKEKVKTVPRQSWMSKIREALIVKVPEVCVRLDRGNEGTPLLSMRLALDLTISNWSYQFQGEGKLSIGMKYFNNRNAAWEPIVEPVPTRGNMTFAFRDWMLRFQIEKNEQNIVTTVMSDGSSRRAPLTVSIISSDILNITLTKTCLDICSKLSEIFSDVMYKPESHSLQKAVYIIRNETGELIKVHLANEFVVHQSAIDPSVTSVILPTNSCIDLNLISEPQNLGFSGNPKDKYLNITMVPFNRDIRVCISKAAKRSFRLNSSAGNNMLVICDVSALHGQIIITFQSNILFRNNLNNLINIYSSSKSNVENKHEEIVVIEPKSVISLPIGIIYQEEKELFFTTDGYSTTVTLCPWRDIDVVPDFTTVKCYQNQQSQDIEETFIFIRVVREIENVYFENSYELGEDTNILNVTFTAVVVLMNTLSVDIIVQLEGSKNSTVLIPGASTQLLEAEPGVSSLLIQILNYLNSEWHGKILLKEKQTIVILESSSDNLKLELGIDEESVHSSQRYTIFSPFWMVNKTGLLLYYRTTEEKGTVFCHPLNYEGIIMLSLTSHEKTIFAKKKAFIKVRDGDWSDNFILDAPGYSGVLICKTQNRMYRISVQIRMTSNPLTKEVLFTSFYAIFNHHFCPIEVREVGKIEGPWNQVGRSDCVPFWPVFNPGSGNMQVRISETAENSVSFPYSVAHNSILKLNNKYGALNVNIHILENGVLISFFVFEAGSAPVLLLNGTHHEIDVHEKASKTSSRLVLKAHHKALLTWETFSEKHLISFCNQKYSADINKDNIGKFKVMDEVLYWSSFLFGLQRIFLFTDNLLIATESVNFHDYERISQEIDIRISEIGLSFVDEQKKIEILYFSLSKSDVVWVSRITGRNKFAKFSREESKQIECAYQDYVDAETYLMNPPSETTLAGNKIDLKKMKVVSKREKELERHHIEGLRVNIKMSTYLSKVHVQIFRLQIDQQSWDSVFPVFFLPVNLHKTSRMEPFIELSMLKVRNKYSGVDQIKYIGVMIKEFHVRIDTGLLVNLFAFLDAGTLNPDIESIGEDIERSMKDLSYFMFYTTQQEQKYYYEKLQLYPLKMHLSFSHKSGESNEDKKNALPPIISLFVRSLGITLTTIHDVIFKINHFEREFVLLSRSELIDEIEEHYIHEILRQLYVLVFGLDAFGNPFGLVRDFRQGATDFIQQPFQGAVQGPEAFAEGLLQGFRSLVRHTIGATAGAVSKVTATLGEGLAALTFDNDYQELRKQYKIVKPRSFQDGFAKTGRGLVMGVLEGVGGVFKKPLDGAKVDGVGGFVLGAGKGVVGLFTKPASALVDFTSGLLATVRRVAETGEETGRFRNPRYIRPDGIIRPYSPIEAEGYKYLQELSSVRQGKVEEYVFHMEIGGSLVNKDILLLTDKRIAYFGYNDIFGNHQLGWSHDWREISGPPEVLNDGIRFWIRSIHKSKSSNWTDGKLILINESYHKKRLLILMNEFIERGYKKCFLEDKN